MQSVLVQVGGETRIHTYLLLLATPTRVGARMWAWAGTSDAPSMSRGLVERHTLPLSRACPFGFRSNGLVRPASPARARPRHAAVPLPQATRYIQLHWKEELAPRRRCGTRGHPSSSGGARARIHSCTRALVRSRRSRRWRWPPWTSSTSLRRRTRRRCALPGPRATSAPLCCRRVRRARRSSGPASRPALPPGTPSLPSRGRLPSGGGGARAAG